MKKITALLLIAAMMISLLACGSKEQAPAGAASAGASGEIKTIGICMPTKEQTIWSTQGDRLVEYLNAAGYETMIEYAEDDSSRQASQVENMITKGVDCLIIAAVDCAALTDCCEKAKAAGIYVIADDRAITNTEAVDYWVTCDYSRLAEMQGQYIVDKLDLANADRVYTMEIFSGSQDDTNSLIFYEGQMKALQPYIDNGTIVIKSGQTSPSETAIQSWDAAKAQARMDNLLAGYYSDGHLDICLSTADCLALGCISSLESMGYGNNGIEFPIVTGQDAELAAIKNIIAGKQTMTVFIDAILLAEKVVELVDALSAGTTIEYTETYDNNAKEVPMITYDPYLIDKSNTDHLIEVGFYTAEELK